LDYLSIALNLDVLFRCASTDSEHYQGGNRKNRGLKILFVIKAD